jgi:phytoene desaturase
MSKICVIGSGFSGLSAACYLSAQGHEVHVFEKNSTPGGRARQLITDHGFVFDMGPSWYWMPDVFENFFNDFGYSARDFYRLGLLSPSFSIVFGKDDVMQVPSDFRELCTLFESIEKGSGEKLVRMMDDAEIKYNIGIKNLVLKPGLSIREFLDKEILKGFFNLQVFSSFSSYIRKYFTHPKLIALMEFPILFLGAMPEQTPALYSLMNYAGLKLGTWYPQGGFGKVIDAFMAIAKKNGVHFHFDSPIKKINSSNGNAVSVDTIDGEFTCNGIIASADYHHTENDLLDESQKNYKEAYWEKKTFAPSCLIFYLGIDKKIKSIGHHTLFFDESLSQHSKEIYEDPKWPTSPLFYACCPSKKDNTVAPDGHENIFLLMPIAPGLEDNDNIREKYFPRMIKRLEDYVSEKILPHIIYKKSYCIKDFVMDYNSYRGNAYGLANTLIQTAILKPKIKNHKIANLFYCGQLTVPGPGVPPSIISGKIAAGLLSEKLKTPTKKHEAAV